MQKNIRTIKSSLYEFSQLKIEYNFRMSPFDLECSVMNALDSVIVTIDPVDYKKLKLKNYLNIEIRKYLIK